MFKNIFFATLLLSLGLTVFAPTTSHAVEGSDFPFGNIIDDATFTDSSTMTVPEIQSFLESKVTGGQCDRYRATYNDNYNPPWTCLFEFQQNPTTGANNYGLFDDNGTPNDTSDDTPQSISGGKTAAEIIWQAGQDHQINPQVLIVLLQKEQGLVTDNWPWTVQYSKATGYLCPDTAPCDSAQADFYKQVDGAAKLFRFYLDNLDLYWYQIGQNDILYNPNHSCGRKSINIENAATVALYLYTPYTPNQAALDNLYGTGDSCSAYGNRNFWRYFNDWFGSTSASPFFRIDGSTSVYTLGSDNNYYWIESASKLETYGYNTIFTDIEDYDSSYIELLDYDGALPRVARFEGAEVYLVDSGQKHYIQSQSLLEDTYGYTWGAEALLPQQLSQYIPTASTNLSTIVGIKDSPQKYLIQEAVRRKILDSAAYESGTPAYSSLPVSTLSINALENTTDGALLIADGTIVSDETNKYSLRDNELVELDSSIYSGVLADYQLSTSRIQQFVQSADTIGDKVVNAANYGLVSESQMIELDSSELIDLGLDQADFVQVPSVFLGKIPISDANLDIFRINGSSSIYSIRDGEIKRYINKDAIEDAGLSINQAQDLPAGFITNFTNDSDFILAKSQLFRINSQSGVYIVSADNKAYRIPSREIFEAYGLSFNNVVDMSTIYLDDYAIQGSLPYFASKTSGQIWHLSEGVRRYTSPEQQDTSIYDLDIASLPVLEDQVFFSLKSSTPLSRVVTSSETPKVYVVEDGQKRWVTSLSALLLLGYTADDIQTLSPGYINSIPDGPRVD